MKKCAQLASQVATPGSTATTLVELPTPQASPPSPAPHQPLSNGDGDYFNKVQKHFFCVLMSSAEYGGLGFGDMDQYTDRNLAEAVAAAFTSCLEGSCPLLMGEAEELGDDAVCPFDEDGL